MKTAVTYYSRHHENTKQVPDAIARGRDVTLIDVAETHGAPLEDYDLIGYGAGKQGCTKAIRFFEGITESSNEGGFLPRFYRMPSCSAQRVRKDAALTTGRGSASQGVMAFSIHTMSYQRPNL